MMSSQAYGAALLGVDGLRITVEVDFLRRLPSVAIVGLPSLSVRESADRVRSAMLASGFEFPRQRIVVSLAPADVRKDGTGFDLPIAAGILLAAGRLDPERCARYLLVGELTLGGELRPVRGSLAFAALARDLGMAGLVLPPGAAEEAALVSEIDVRVALTLGEAAEFLGGVLELPRARPPRAVRARGALDLRDVRGQTGAREALEVAAAGGHNLLLEGPPGCGKTMLAARIPSILPTLTPEESLACTRIHSAAGLLGGGGLVAERPFRAPHHSISPAGLVGGALLRPGEASLAHNGVLFLDEFPEFPRHAREVLRAPLEDRQIVLARAGGSVTFPASFMLVAAANPCPCGNLGHPTRPCLCGEAARQRYRARLSGPLLDRIDLRVELSPVTPSVLLSGTASEDSATVRGRVERARQRQRQRYGGMVANNAALTAEQVVEAADPTPAALSALQRHMEQQGLSARVGRRLLKVARTLADLDELSGGLRVHEDHVHRAVALRLDDAEMMQEAGCSAAS